MKIGTEFVGIGTEYSERESNLDCCSWDIWKQHW